MKKGISVLAACLLLAGAVFGGCGGGSQSGSGSSGGEAASAATEAGGDGEGSEKSGAEVGAASEKSESLSKSEFVAKASALCAKRQKEVQAELRKIVKNSPSKVSQEEGLRLIVEKAVGPAMEGEAEELRALGAPAGDDEKMEEIATAIEAVVEEAREDPQGVATNSAAFSEPQKAAREYGIASCGSP
jgi:hypothetical protein